MKTKLKLVFNDSEYSGEEALKIADSALDWHNIEPKKSHIIGSIPPAKVIIKGNKIKIKKAKNKDFRAKHLTEKL